MRQIFRVPGCQFGHGGPPRLSIETCSSAHALHMHTAAPALAAALGLYSLFRSCRSVFSVSLVQKYQKYIHTGFDYPGSAAGFSWHCRTTTAVPTIRATAAGAPQSSDGLDPSQLLHPNPLRFVPQRQPTPLLFQQEMRCFLAD